jgi:hypothetical protein
MSNNKAALLAKLQARNVKTALKCAAARAPQSHTPAQAKAIVIKNINANIQYLQTQDEQVKFTQLYKQLADGTFEVAAKYGNSYLHNWLAEELADGTIEERTCLRCEEDGLVQTLQVLLECVEEGHADEAIAAVQLQHKAAGKLRNERRLQGKRVKVQG